MTANCKTYYFDARLTPNQSLSPKAFSIVMVIVGVMSFIGGMAFVSMGAFPVIGFFGVDALAIWLAFHFSFKKLRQETQIRVSAESVELRHTEPGKPIKTATVPTAFARIELEYPDRQPSELRIAHGQSAWVIGRFLTPAERKSLKEALNSAIQRARSERYAT